MYLNCLKKKVFYDIVYIISKLGGGIIIRTIWLTESEFRSLTKYYLSNDIIHYESEIYRLDLESIKKKYKNCNLLLKSYDKYTNLKEKERKIYTVKKLAFYEEKLNIKELNIPKFKVNVTVKDCFQGFALSEVEKARNLGTILHSDEVAMNAKLYYLYKVGKLIEKIQKQNILKFNLGDLQEYNFVIDANNNIHAVDLDSVYLEGIIPTQARYLYRNACISHFKNKYRYYSSSVVYPNNNTDLLCYNLIILNTIFNRDFSYISLNDFQKYIRYLKYIGCGKELLNSFNRMYSNYDNINPYSYLEQIPYNNIMEAKTLTKI